MNILTNPATLTLHLIVMFKRDFDTYAILLEGHFFFLRMIRLFTTVLTLLVPA